MRTFAHVSWVAVPLRAAFFSAVALLLAPAANALVPLEGISQVSLGEGHSCVLTVAGGVKCWGDNSNGQLGDGTNVDRLMPADVSGLQTGVTGISAGGQHTCAVKNGGVKCWGWNGWGQLGDGSTLSRSSPVDVSGLASGVLAVATGGVHSCAIVTGGAIKCWGRAGAVGDGGSSNRLTPVTVTVAGVASGVTSIAAGGRAFDNSGHTCAVTAGGGVKCWGGFGPEVGDGSLTSGIARVTAGGAHTCALTTTGGVKCWGVNDFRALGSAVSSGPTPIDVPGLTGGVLSVAAGEKHTCAVTAANGLKCWGFNNSGQLGNGSTGAFASPGDVAGLTSGVAMVAGGGRPLDGGHTCAVGLSGAVKCWGNNGDGQLGDSTRSYRRSPVPVAGGITSIAGGMDHTCALTIAGGVKCWGSNNTLQLGAYYPSGLQTSPIDVPGLTSGVAAIVAGGFHNCALTVAGGVKCWGSNQWGQLGGGDAFQTGVVDVSGLSSGVQALAAGLYHTCALTAAQGVKCWGQNSSGQLGNNQSPSGSSVPVDVTGLTSGVSKITAGLDHTCAVTSAGAAKCWGDNDYGQVGNGSSGLGSSVPSPANVTGLGSGVLTIAAGGWHTCALTNGGNTKCWGRNSSGQLGDGTTQDRSAPVANGQPAGATALAAGFLHSCSISSAGGLACWGMNRRGQLGDGSIISRVLPVPVAGLQGGVTSVTAGGEHTCAISAGTATCWGYNYRGQLGLGSGQMGLRTSPANVLIMEPPTLTAAASALSHSVAVDSNGKVYAWGSDSHGQLGQARAINRPTPAVVPGIPSMGHVSLSQHALAVETASPNQVWSWGENSCGQLGPRGATITTKPSPVIGVTAATRVASGGCFSLALKSDGTVWGWGLVPGYGSSTAVRQLSGLTLGSEIQAGARHALVRRQDGTVWALGENGLAQLGQGYAGPTMAAVQVSLAGAASEIAAGQDSSAARLASGALVAWGRQADGSVLLGPTTLPSTPSPAVSIAIAGADLLAALGNGTIVRLVSVASGWQAVGTYSGITRVEGGVGFNLGLGAGGQVFAQGTNTAGQLGQGNTAAYAGVLTVPGMTNVSQLAAGTVNTSVLALKADGSLWFWGADTLGESGDGAAIGSSVPVLVNLPVAIREAVVGDRFSIALDVNGDVWGWGDNGGAAIDGTLVNRSVPARIPGASNVIQIAAGGPGLVLYLQADGSVLRSGTLLPGVVADGPVEVLGLSSAVAIAAGSSGYALKSDGRVVSFGGNASGELGDGTTTSRVDPVLVTGISGGVVKIAAGQGRAAALTPDGKAWSWGAGPLGNGSSGGSTTAVAATGINDAVSVSVGRTATLVVRGDQSLAMWGDAGLKDASGQNALLPYRVAFAGPVRSARLGGNNGIGSLMGNTGLVWGFGKILTFSNLSAAIGDGTYVSRDRPVVLSAAGGGGSLETNNWFLDLEPVTPEAVPAASTPSVLGLSDLSGYGNAEGLTLSASLKGRAADQGKVVGTYVFAFVPADFLKSARMAPSFSKAKIEELQKSSDLQFLQLTEDGWTNAFGQLIAYTSGVLDGSVRARKILDGTPFTAMDGVRFCIGYGESAGSMLTSGTLREVLRIDGATGNIGGQDCVLNGVYVTGPDKSLQGSVVSFEAMVVGATPTGTVQFTDSIQGITQNMQEAKTLALANEAVSTAAISTNTLTLGTHSIGAIYSGNTQNARRLADTEKVHKVESSATVLLAGPVGSKFGESVTFTATVSGNNPTADVQFKVDGANFQVPARLDAQKVARLSTSALALGVRQVTATFLGDAANGLVQSNQVTHTVSSATANVSLTATPSPAVTGTPVSLNVSVTGVNPTGNVTFRVDGVELATTGLSSGAASFVTSTLPAGMNYVTADYSGDGPNSPASAGLWLRITAPPSLVPLTVTKTGGGTGTVSSSPAGITCGATCSSQILTGSTMTLTATPAGGSSFVGWAGACSGAGTCTLTIEAATSVSARFEKAGSGITLAPAALAFGGQSMNTTAPTQTVTLTNNSAAAIEVTAVEAPPGFGKGYGCSAVSPGASCPVYVSFTPTVQGAYAANVAVLYTQGGETRVSLLPVTGTGERSLVTHYYQSILRRAPDSGGKAFWDGEATRVTNLGANVNEVWYSMAQTFYSSAEYAAFNRDNTGFITDLYVTFFSRQPDSGGLSFWVNNLNGGMPREVALAEFMLSAEFRSFSQAIFGTPATRAENNMVMDFYRGLLSRLPDDGGFNFWAGRFRTAQCLSPAEVVAQVESISSAFTLSPEYAGRNRTNAQYVGDLYNAFLRRGGDLGGVQFWINEINTRARTREQVRVDFKNSPEFQNRVSAIVVAGCLR